MTHDVYCTCSTEFCNSFPTLFFSVSMTAKEDLVEPNMANGQPAPSPPPTTTVVDSNDPETPPPDYQSSIKNENDEEEEIEDDNRKIQLNK